MPCKYVYYVMKQAGVCFPPSVSQIDGLACRHIKNLEVIGQQLAPPKQLYQNHTQKYC